MCSLRSITISTRTRAVIATTSVCGRLVDPIWGPVPNAYIRHLVHRGLPHGILACSSVPSGTPSPLRQRDIFDWPSYAARRRTASRAGIKISATSRSRLDHRPSVVGADQRTSRVRRDRRKARENPSGELRIVDGPRSACRPWRARQLGFFKSRSTPASTGCASPLAFPPTDAVACRAYDVELLVVRAGAQLGVEVRVPPCPMRGTRAPSWQHHSRAGVRQVSATGRPVRWSSKSNILRVHKCVRAPSWKGKTKRNQTA